MAISDELLNTVKLSLSILDNSSDAVIRQKIAAAADYLKERGVSDKRLDTPTGIETIALYVTEHWTVSGDVKESQAFWEHLSTLYSSSKADMEEESDYAATQNCCIRQI